MIIETTTEELLWNAAFESDNDNSNLDYNEDEEEQEDNK